jgi:hypothetical protein
MRSHVNWPTTFEPEPTMTITVKIRYVYGNRTIYPVCAQAELFAQIAGSKTLPFWVIDKIKRLGYAVEVEQEPVTL